jgi:hypothetical protein
MVSLYQTFADASDPDNSLGSLERSGNERSSLTGLDQHGGNQTSRDELPQQYVYCLSITFHIPRRQDEKQFPCASSSASGCADGASLMMGWVTARRIGGKECCGTGFA